MADRVSVLFVCLGNICRSPLAEAAFRAEARRRGLEVEANSAGTGTWHLGEPPDPRAQAVAAAAGIDISGYRARQVTPADFDRFTHVVALDHENLAVLERLKPAGAGAELSLLLDHAPGRGGEAVSDPYYGAEDRFSTTWADVTAGAAGLMTRLTEGA